MTQNTIVDPSLAPLGRGPRLLEVRHLEPKRLADQRYRAEAWSLSNGEVAVVIVSSNGGTSLMNASEQIAQAVDEHWPNATIIEDWSP